jgi:hypothetical protein
MRRRCLDAARQYLRAILLALVVIPGVVAAVSLGLTRSEVVTARLWVDRPTYVRQTSVGDPTGAPAETEAARVAVLVRQLLRTASFVDRVLSGAQSGYAGLAESEKAARRRDLRSALEVGTDGPHLLALSYRIDGKEPGLAVLSNLIQALGDTAPLLDFSPPPIADRSAGADLHAARALVERSWAGMVDSAGAPGPPQPMQLEDLTFPTLLLDATSKTVQYRHQLQALLDAPQSGSAWPVPAAQAVVQVADPPAMEPKSAGPAERAFLLALLGTAAAGLGLICLAALVDPRMRSGRDVAERSGIRYLGSIPVPAARTP